MIAWKTLFCLTEATIFISALRIGLPGRQLSRIPFSNLLESPFLRNFASMWVDRFAPAPWQQPYWPWPFCRSRPCPQAAYVRLVDSKYVPCEQCARQLRWKTRIARSARSKIKQNQYVKSRSWQQSFVLEETASHSAKNWLFQSQIQHKLFHWRWSRPGSAFPVISSVSVTLKSLNTNWRAWCKKEIYPKFHSSTEMKEAFWPRQYTEKKHTLTDIFILNRTILLRTSVLWLVPGQSQQGLIRTQKIERKK